MLRRKASSQPGSTRIRQEMLTSRKKKLMRKMSDIILKELQSESDDEDAEPPKKSKASPNARNSAPPKKHPISDPRVVTQDSGQDLSDSPCDVTLSPRTIGSGSVDFTLADTEDDGKSFDLSPSPPQPSLTNCSAIDSSPVDKTALDNSPEIVLGESAPHQDDDLGEANAAKVRRKKRNGKIASKVSTEYYRQLYRPAWEQMAEFKGWLSAVPDVPTKAHCLYCGVALSAHHVSLLKHVASAKHQRNAERMFILNTTLYDPRSCGKTNNSRSLPLSQAASRESVPPSVSSQGISNRSASYTLAGTGTAGLNNKLESGLEEDNLLLSRTQPSLLSTHSTAEEDMDDLFDKVHIILADDCVGDDDEAKEDVAINEEQIAASNDHTVLNNKNHSLLNENDRTVLNGEDHTMPNEDHTVLDGKVAGTFSDAAELNEKEADETLTEKEQIVTLNDLDEEFSEEEETGLVQVVKVPKESIVLAACTGSDRFQPISTHVIDSHAGLPISNLEITLYKLVNGAWRLVSELATNAGGRATDFIPDMDSFQCGRYKLHYHVFKYFELKRVNSIFPFIEVPFDVRRTSDHLHFPLILSANGFSVYKGCAL